MSYQSHGLFKQVCEEFALRLDLSLKELADHLGIDRHTLSNLVKKQTGMSFRHWSQGQRLDRACRVLLESPTSTIKEVAFSAGYRSPQVFVRAFRRQHEITPSAWRDREGPSVRRNAAGLRTTTTT